MLQNLKKKILENYWSRISADGPLQMYLDYSASYSHSIFFLTFSLLESEKLINYHLLLLTRLESQDSLFVLMAIRLRHGLVQVHEEFLAPERMWLIMDDQAVQAIEHYRIYEIELALALLQTGFDTTVIDSALPPEKCPKIWNL